jgi:hypothetical protein
MFIGCIWLNHKPYDNFEGHNIPFYGVGYIEKRFFLVHFVDFFISMGFGIATLVVGHMCNKIM